MLRSSYPVRATCSATHPTQASPAQLAAIIRGHWGIEDRLHWVRDLDYDEDRFEEICAEFTEFAGKLEIDGGSHAVRRATARIRDVVRVGQMPPQNPLRLRRPERVEDLQPQAQAARQVGNLPLERAHGDAEDLRGRAGAADRGAARGRGARRRATYVEEGPPPA